LVSLPLHKFAILDLTRDVELNGIKWNSLEQDAVHTKFNKNPYKETNSLPRQPKTACYKLTALTEALA
jgi:hypothetical protein